MTQEKDAKLTPTQELEEMSMPIIRCAGCEFERVLNFSKGDHDPMSSGWGWIEKDQLFATLVCGKCGYSTAFILHGSNALGWIEKKDTYGALVTKASAAVKQVFREAELSYSGRAYRAAATMCRACVEQALVEKGHKKGSLEQKINAAKRANHLGYQEYMIAHGSRLVGNEAVHLKEDLSPSDIPALLSAAVVIVNHLIVAP